MARKEKKQPDHDMETWEKLGGAVVEIDVDDGLTEGERIMRAANAWVRTQLQSSTWRQSPISPFARKP